MTLWEEKFAGFVFCNPTYERSKSDTVLSLVSAQSLSACLPLPLFVRRGSGALLTSETIQSLVLELDQ